MSLEEAQKEIEKNLITDRAPNKISYKKNIQKCCWLHSAFSFILYLWIQIHEPKWMRIRNGSWVCNMIGTVPEPDIFLEWLGFSNMNGMAPESSIFLERFRSLTHSWNGWVSGFHQYKWNGSRVFNTLGTVPEPVTFLGGWVKSILMERLQNLLYDCDFCNIHGNATIISLLRLMPFPQH